MGAIGAKPLVLGFYKSLLFVGTKQLGGFVLKALIRHGDKGGGWGEDK